MADWIAREGGCRCGRVRLAITASPMLTMACHCTGCQKMTASAFSLSVAVPAHGFAVTRGEPLVGGLHGPDHHHMFCPHCMSWLFTRSESMDWFVNVRTTLLDDPSGLEPFIETMTREKLPWAKTPAVHSFEAFPAMDDYERLTHAYAAKAAA